LAHGEISKTKMIKNKKTIACRLLMIGEQFSSHAIALKKEQLKFITKEGSWARIPSVGYEAKA